MSWVSVWGGHTQRHDAADPPGGPRRSRAWRLAGALPLVAAVLGAVGLPTPTAGAAVPEGWYVGTVPGTGLDDILLGSTCANALSCWAVGVSIQFNGSGGYSPLAETWNGSTWTRVASPVPASEGGAFFGVSCLNGSDCWAVGTVLDESGGSGNPTATLAEHWDGSAWSTVSTPTPTGNGVAGAILQSVSCTSSSSCVAVGYSTDSNGENLNALAEQWNGHDLVHPPERRHRADLRPTGDGAVPWRRRLLGGRRRRTLPAEPQLPSHLSRRSGDQGLIEHWDGTAWSVVPSVTAPSPSGGYLNGLECVDATDCWASGATTDSTGMASGILMQHWDGSSWTDVSASVPEPDPGTGAILSGIAV